MNISFNSLTSSPNQLLNLMSEIQYKEFDTLMSTAEVLNTLSGSCHDQVMVELDELTKQGLNPIGKFIMAVDIDNVGGETHSFVYWLQNGKAYWFEHAWEDFAGIHEFESEQDLLEYVIDMFTNRNPGQYIYLGDFIPQEHKIGEDLQTLVDICMEDAIQV